MSRIACHQPALSKVVLGGDDEVDFDGVPNGDRLRDDLGLPWRLRDVGVTEEDFGGIAKDAMEDLIVASNPRKVESNDQVIDLLRTAW